MHFPCVIIWINIVLSDYAYVLGKHAALTDMAEDQCFLSQAEITTSGAVDITDMFQDSNHSTCLHLADKTGTRLRILISLFPYRAISNVYVIGHSLNCSPQAGMRMSMIYGCKSGKCAAICTAGESFVNRIRIVCRYKCHCFGICHAVVLDVLKMSLITAQWEICEIVI